MEVVGIFHGQVRRVSGEGAWRCLCSPPQDTLNTPLPLKLPDLFNRISKPEVILMDHSFFFPPKILLFEGCSVAG